jgi:hypothetical protein
MKKTKKKYIQLDYVDGIRVSKSFYMLAEAKAAFITLAREGRCGQQNLIDTLILRASAASPREKDELFRAAHEAAKTAALARLDRRYARDMQNLATA